MAGAEETHRELTPFADKDNKIATEALARELVTNAELAACRLIQARLAAKGKAISLVEMMVKQKAISAAQAEQLKKAVGDMPERIGGYEIIKPLGRGAMSEVFLARQVAMNRQVALKVVAPELVAIPGWLPRFRREAQSVARLNHPNIVQAYDAGEDGSHHYIAMEYVAGEDLGSRLEREKMLDEGLVKRVAREMAQALNHAHEHQVIHRDIKPANILLTEKGQAKLADYGLAKQEGGDQSQLTVAGMSVGTPYYISPEQVETPQSIDIRADIYCLGATLYHLLAGRPPFPGKSPTSVVMKVLHDDPEPLTRINPHLDARFCRVVMKMMDRSPGKRYQTPAKLLEALDELGRPGEEPAPVPAGSKKPTKVGTRVIPAAEKKPAGANPWLIFGAAAGLAGLAGVFLVLYVFWSFLSSDDPGPGQSATPTAVASLPPPPATKRPPPPVTRRPIPTTPPVTRRPSPSPSAAPVTGPPKPTPSPVTGGPSPSPALPALPAWPPPTMPTLPVEYNRRTDPDRFDRDWRVLTLPDSGARAQPTPTPPGRRGKATACVHRRLCFRDVRSIQFRLSGRLESEAVVFFENLFEHRPSAQRLESARCLVLNGQSNPPAVFFLAPGQRPPEGQVRLPTRAEPEDRRPANREFRLEFIGETMFLSVGAWSGERRWEKDDLPEARDAPLNLRLPPGLELEEVQIEVFR